ncbi:MAG: metal-dependent hydrolase [Halobacteriaceae archaeon]
MFVGHSLLAFAIVGTAARYSGVAARRALAVAAVAGLFAAAPDVDVAFALHGLVGGSPVADFWAATTVTHRAVTHSLVLAVPAAALAGLWTAGVGSPPVGHRSVHDPPAGDDTALLAAGGLALATVTAVVALGGLLAGALAAAFAIAVCGVATLATRLDLGPRAVGAAALVGLLTHPFGDLFTGTPPAMLWPIDAALVSARVAPFADPTLDFLLAFGVELAAVWAGVLVALALVGRPPLPTLRAAVRSRALVGAAYAGTLFVLPRPTVDFAYLFVFSVLPVGAVGVEGRRRRDAGEWLATVCLTALAAVTVAVLAYGVAYLLAG